MLDQWNQSRDSKKKIWAKLQNTSMAKITCGGMDDKEPKYRYPKLVLVGFSGHFRSCQKIFLTLDGCAQSITANWLIDSETTSFSVESSQKGFLFILKQRDENFSHQQPDTLTPLPLTPKREPATQNPSIFISAAKLPAKDADDWSTAVFWRMSWSKMLQLPQNPAPSPRRICNTSCCQARE